MTVRKTIGGLALVSAILFAPATLPAAEQHQAGETEKDRCLLDPNACADRKDDIQQIIARLKREIGKGEKVYTKEELKLLQRKLEDYENQLFWIINPHGGVK